MNNNEERLLHSIGIDICEQIDIHVSYPISNQVENKITGEIWDLVHDRGSNPVWSVVFDYVGISISKNITI